VSARREELELDVVRVPEHHRALAEAPGRRGTSGGGAARGIRRGGGRPGGSAGIARRGGASRGGTRQAGAPLVVTGDTAANENEYTPQGQWTAKTIQGSIT
jgi:hypothetical protein